MKNLTFFVGLALIVISVKSEAMRISVERCEIPLPNKTYEFEEYGSQAGINEAMVRDSEAVNEREKAFKELCKSKCGRKFEYDSVVERQEESRVSNMRVRLIVHSTVECVKN